MMLAELCAYTGDNLSFYLDKKFQESFIQNVKERKNLAKHAKQLGFKFFGKSNLDFKDILYPWKNSKGKIIIQRYFHLFTKGELETLFKKTGLKIKETGFLKREKERGSNIYIVAEKV
jgi:hypothetical protein